MTTESRSLTPPFSIPREAWLVAALADWLDHPAADPEHLFAALADRTPRPAHPGEAGAEAMFNPVFIAGPVYGTRCSTVVTRDRHGWTHVTESSWDAVGVETGRVVERFQVDRA